MDWMKMMSWLIFLVFDMDWNGNKDISVDSICRWVESVVGTFYHFGGR